MSRGLRVAPISNITSNIIEDYDDVTNDVVDGISAEGSEDSQLRLTPLFPRSTPTC